MEAETILNLRNQLKEAENERRKAAQYGLHLLESQSEVQNQLDQARHELTEKTEKFEQEKYTLQREIELKNRMLENLSFEYDSLKQQQNVQLDKQKEQLARFYGQEIGDLKNKLEDLKAELDETRLSEKQLRHKVDHQKEIIAAKSEELRMMSERVHETMSSEMLNLQIELTELESVKANVEEKLNELQYGKEQLELINCNLRNQLERLQREKEEREKEVVSYCNALEKAREANQELQVQLDHAVQQSLDPTSKGNSLFAEVEDRRAEMERQLISVKIKYQSLQNQHAFTREQLHRMKEIETLKNELSLQRMKALHESQRALEVERKLFTNERHLQTCQSENMNLRVTLDELKMKYEPEELLKGTKIKKKKEKIPVDATCEYLDSKNTSVKEDALTELPSKEETKMTSRDLEQSGTSPKKQALEAPPMNIGLQAMQKVIEPVRERKRVKIKDENHDAFTSCSRSGNSSLTSAASRLTAESSFETTDNEEKKENKIMTEKKTEKKKYTTLYVSSKPTPETQCAQQ
ncbi:PREDICTED: protein Spindly [Calidris pugnax]|uniref:protein Spindly n=1 Tax=Calidris pugnax TaxID=198806 RepID=UPI00071D5C3D|nr:PREDICTED: protein Spindly [Calidris pugnax]